MGFVFNSIFLNSFLFSTCVSHKFQQMKAIQTEMNSHFSFVMWCDAMRSYCARVPVSAMAFQMHHKHSRLNDTHRKQQQRNRCTFRMIITYIFMHIRMEHIFIYEIPHNKA